MLILKGLRERYEQHHRVRITDAALEAAASLSKRYVTDRFLPDKAIDLIDEASARARIKTLEAPDELKALERSIGDLRKEKEEAAAAQEFEKAAYLRDEERKAKEQSEQWRKEWTEKQNKIQPEITAEAIAEIVAESTGIPVTQLTEEESRRLLRMEDELRKRVVGQDEALHAVARAVRRARSGMKDRSARRQLPLPWPDRRRKDGARAVARGISLRQRRGDDKDRHERIYGAPRSG